MNIRVNKVVSSDQKTFDACFELHQANQPYPWSQKVFLDMQTAPYTAYVALSEESSIVGYAMTLTVLDEVTLMDIAVCRSWRKQGIGEQLLSAIEDNAINTHKANIFLEVRENNLPARRLYQKWGFDKVALRKNYYPGTVDPSQRENAIIMEKRF